MARTVTLHLLPHRSDYRDTYNLPEGAGVEELGRRTKTGSDNHPVARCLCHSPTNPPNQGLWWCGGWDPRVSRVSAVSVSHSVP